MRRAATRKEGFWCKFGFLDFLAPVGELIFLVYFVTVRAVKRGLHQSRDLVDTEQCLGLVPGDVPTARVFLQGLVCMQPRPKPGEIFLRV
jgi:hypothetical protein